MATSDTSIPRAPKKLAGASFAAYGAWLAEQGHPIAPVIAADVRAIAKPHDRAAKKLAHDTFRAYVAAHLAPRFPKLVDKIRHFTERDLSHYASFRCGFLSQVDSFGWTKPQIRALAELLADDHARWLVVAYPRGIAFTTLDAFADRPALRKLHFGWSDLSKLRSIAPLATSRTLQALDLTGSAVTDLTPLRKVPIVQLHLERSKVRDLAPLAKHPTLEDLDASYTAISSIAPLVSCKQLVHVNLYGSKVSAADAEVLIAAMKKHRARAKGAPHLLCGYAKGLMHDGAYWG